MAAAVAATTALGWACGDAPVDQGQDRPVTTPAPAATSTTVGGRAHVAELTTSDGHRYKVTLVVGPRSPTGTAEECAGPAASGRFHLPVTLTVANEATDRPAPFPPLRVEMPGPPGTRPAQVQVRDAAGACTFAPRVPSIPPGGSVTFKGTSPPIEETASPGSAGRIEVRASESSFALAAPLP